MKPSMKPWTERTQIASALKNEHVRIGERELPGGGRLRGLYALKDFAFGDYVASFHGRVIAREKLMALRETDRALFETISEYAVWNSKARGHLYPEDVGRIGAHLINHSCGPNTKWAQIERGALLARALKPIAAGEELTTFYGWVGMKAAMEKSWHPCACGAPFCAGTVELYVEFDDHGDGTGGPYLSPEEAGRRLLADIMNDTDAHEALLYRYADESHTMTHGTEILTRVDPIAFAEKLREGAHAAVATARRLQATGRALSERRLGQIVRDHKVPS